MEKCEEKVALNGKEIQVIVKNVKRSKSIKICVKDEKVCINKPIYVSRKRALKMLLENENVVLKMLENSGNSLLGKIINEDNYFLYNGEKTSLVIKCSSEKKFRASFENNKLVVSIYEDLEESDKTEIIKKALIKLFKKELNEVLKLKVQYYSNLMNISYNKFFIKNMRTRFGSCNPKTKNLNFNINLVFMPEEVRDSIIVHELSHIIYANHSKDFYALVYKYLPNYTKCKKWIKENSSYLNILN